MLGTATNLNMAINNIIANNTPGGQGYTSANGLSTSTQIQLTFSFVAPTSSGMNVIVGSSGTTGGVIAQSAGTVYTYGWQICYENKTTHILGNLLVDKP